MTLLEVSSELSDGRARERSGSLLIVRGSEAVDRVFRLALDGHLTFVEHPDDDLDDLGEREAADA